MLAIKIRTKNHSDYLKDVVEYQDECKEHDVVWSCKGQDWEKFFSNLFNKDTIKLDPTFRKLDELIDIIVYDDDIQNFLNSNEDNFVLPKSTKGSLEYFCEHNPRFEYEVIEKILTSKRNLKKLIGLWDMTYYFLCICQDNPDAKLDISLE